MKWKIASLCLFWAGMSVFAQEYFPKNDGVKAKNANYTAFTNARIIVTPEQIIEKGTLLVQDGKVVQAGSSVSLPENTVTYDLDGKWIYPSFIDPFSEAGVKQPNRQPGGGRSPQYDASREGFYWNDHVKAEQQALEAYSFDKKKAEELQKIGFGVVNSHVKDGIARGTGVLLALNSDADEAERVLQPASGNYFSLSKSVTSRQSYPTSLMGSMALLRQMYHDANWYAKGSSNTTDRALEALNQHRNLVQIFAAGDNRHIIRADGIGDAFGIQYVILAGGQEYENIEAVKATNASLIVPLNFPAAYDVSNPYQAGYVSLEDMRHWNQAPANPAVIQSHGIRFSFTLDGLKSSASFLGQIRKAMEYGLSEADALRALTLSPAQILKKEEMIGSLQNGRLANFLITSGPVFDKETTIFENWILGKRHILQDMHQKDIRGTYLTQISGNTLTLEISGAAHAPKLKAKKDTLDLTSKLSYKNNWVDISLTDKEADQTYRMTALANPNSEQLQGRLVLPDGKETSFSAMRTADHEPKSPSAKESTQAQMVPVTFPNVGYGYAAKPQQEDILFRNATVWTGEAAGILNNTDVLIRKGKISRIGKDLNPGSARVIDASGKHLTAGIIDEHSHIAALSINEAGHNSSAEVRMSDALDPEDINIYRNLAGGVTSLQLLHGSANPIGGQSAVLKLKWGEDAQGLLFPEMPKFIKFALGENVKQSNWQSFARFPQTRMGVEQVFMNYFQRAKEYQAKKDAGEAIRYDQEMETLSQILRGERFISCHSYVQSEINMLMKVAEKMNFRVNTFTHILEGYKVADKMAAHGVGGSTFSDWWAYKFEVNDAIPYNAAIMHNQGVTVAINSDDAEMSRRLNQEAAKTVKYGGMSEEEAWKTVTLNPAKLLHIDHRVGSIKEGKDADLVLWSDHPLSVYAKAEKTLIEGTTYFDLETDRKQRASIAQQRTQLINMMLEDKSGGKKRTPRQNQKERMHCDSL